MSSLLRYLYNCNKKKVWIIYFGFITISLILLFNMKGASGIRVSNRQDIALIIFIFLFCMTAFSIFLLAISSFRKIVRGSMIQYVAITSKKYIYANLLFFIIMFTLLSLIGIAFLHLLSINIYENKANGGVQQAINRLYNYGLLHHLFSIFLWIIDLVSTLVSLYFIIIVVKLFNVKSSLNKMLFIIFFVVFGGIQFVITNMLDKINIYVFSIKNVGVIDKNGFFETSFYFNDASNISYLIFSLLLTFLLMVITSHIIDKKLEV
ncbi:ABC transporter permease [Bacillus pseudomycoides]|uniref:ABC transporter permease n=1 Tax=Bacillus pseudomycoides TaxID=64104 RepID=UPI000BF23672|nr:ABC transporter permease [Bacillus pseudomycoides]PEK69230.1 ABC transporter permease [Bacillus pseudomycoides]PEP41493.1 ABC transporter permease [Bacillus pseudomycoides]PEP48055.1 ABC transporter permease [Bacillus pseudomycoides]PFX52179.1 ABC transporter permease [Bacillus pseudomycoides]PFY59272.1 ABC transporter permease [Bacillus pseudomycoides]